MTIRKIDGLLLVETLNILRQGPVEREVTEFLDLVSMLVELVSAIFTEVQIA